MCYESNEDNQFEEIFFVGHLAMAVTTKGEIWVIGGEDFSPSDQEEQEESKEEIINTNE